MATPVPDARARSVAALSVAHQAFLASRADDPTGLMALRGAAMDRFLADGLPDPDHEAWRFTSLAPIVQSRLALADTAPISPDLGLAAVAIPGACTVVLVDGRFVPELSDIALGPPAVRVTSLAQALREPGGPALDHLGQHATNEVSPFVALANAFLADGVLVHVPAGVSLEAPIHIVSLSSQPLDPPTRNAPDVAMSFPRALVFLGANARATVVESFAAGPGACLTCPVTEIVVGHGASLEHHRLQEDALDAMHMAALCLRLEPHATARSHALSSGAALARLEIRAALAGEGADCTLNGLYLTAGTQHVDTHLRVDHLEPRGTSRELYKGVMDDASHAVFTGRIHVRRQAQQTDARQSNRNLLLSRQARVNTNPQLEIFADDVKCTHGATVGQLDEDALFYLRARGIDEQTARAMLVHAFAADLLTGISVPQVGARMERVLTDRLASRAPSATAPASRLPT